MKIITVVGARPQFIKASIVSAEILKHKNIEEVIIHTGQHFDEKMSKVFFDQLNIPSPKYTLNINQLSHGAMTGRMIEEIEKILLAENPDWVIVYGDTNSTLAGALAAKKLNIRVAHIEAGLRSFNIKMPEEINRVLTDRISDILFCPTTSAIENLKREGFDTLECKIEKCGDVMYDAFLLYKDHAIEPNIKLPLNFCFATIHRAENTDEIKPLTEIFDALVIISQTLPLIISIHPRTIQFIEKHKIDTKGLIVLPPLSYFETLYILNLCDFVITDSGGLQKEAYFFKKMCLTLRYETEWVELVEQKANILVGNTKESIIKAFKSIDKLQKYSDFTKTFWGNGDTGKKIVMSLS